MKKLVLVLFFGISLFNAQAQIMKRDPDNGLSKVDSTSFKDQVKIKLDGTTKYTDYKIISINNDTTVVDTTLTLKKDFLFNYLRKDNFELLPFHNQGQTFNKLAYNFENSSLLPTIGANAKQYNYFKVEDISYYEVPTPTSEIMYRTGLEQGQVLDAFLTMNMSRQFNFSVAYKGLRSLGKYRYSLASHGNFRTTFNYHTKNKKYFARGHFSSFDLLNNENGGLTPASITYFENGDPNYTDRARLEVNFTDAENLFEGKRYYFEQQIILFSKKNKINEHNTAISNKIKKHNSLLKEIEVLKQDTVSTPKKLPISSSTKKQGLTKNIPPKKKTPILKTELIKTDNPIKIDSIIKEIPLKKSDSIIKLDSIKPNNVIKIDSLTKNIPLKKSDSIGKLDSIKTNNIIKIDSLTKEIPLKKIDSIGKLDSIKMVTIKKIDSLLIVASEINIDSTQFIKVDGKSHFELKFGHSFMYETQHYRFNQKTANPIFGDSYGSPITDHTSYQKLDNQVYLQLNTPYIGSLKTKMDYLEYDYHYNSILYFDSQTISDKLKGKAIVAGAEWKTQFGMIYLDADATKILSGDITGSSAKAAAMIKKDSVFSFKGFAEITSKSPDFNKLLYQSDYKTYNWQNDFKNEEIKNLGIEFNLTKWGNIRASYNIIDNYTYFDESSKPVQAIETLTYLKATASNSITFRKFTLDNTVMYQKVSTGASFFKVPKIVTRNTIYYSNYLFKGKPLYLQTGVTLKYFTAFNANAYNPLLSEFVLQNTSLIGNYPVLDFFMNAEIQRTRIYFKIENVSASFTGRTYYSAPNYPYRDLTVRFGLVWNWFI